MNWYKIIKISQVRGEFWINESGQVIEASGDGDYNHEGYVIETIKGLLSDGYEYEDWKNQQVLEILEEKKEELEEQKANLEEKGEDTKPIDDALYEIWEMSQETEYHSYQLFLDNIDNLDFSIEDFEIAEGQGDARRYAMKNWGWKRLEGNNVETWSLTKGDMRVIADGLYDAYDEAVKNSNFNIYVYGNEKYYPDVPWSTIESLDIKFLREFNSNMITNADNNMNWYKFSQKELTEGMRGTYPVGRVRVPVVLTGLKRTKAPLGVARKMIDVDIWEAVDESSNRKMLLWNIDNFQVNS